MKTQIFDKETRNDLLETLEECGWDNFIDEVADEAMNMFENNAIPFEQCKYTLDLQCLYNHAYILAIDDDIDGGICYEIRRRCIEKMAEIVEEGIEG